MGWSKYRVEDILSQIESATNKVRGVLLGELSTSIYVITNECHVAVL
jgi:hypothetical protein